MMRAARNVSLPHRLHHRPMCKIAHWRGFRGENAGKISCMAKGKKKRREAAPGKRVDADQAISPGKHGGSIGTINSVPDREALDDSSASRAGRTLRKIHGLIVDS